uniref:Uncharacterized protein n=1 Tax=Parascaris univalens TaxID=6257 RepID=A0A915ANC0_PARUN
MELNILRTKYWKVFTTAIKKERVRQKITKQMLRLRLILNISGTFNIVSIILQKYRIATICSSITTLSSDERKFLRQGRINVQFFEWAIHRTEYNESIANFSHSLTYVGYFLNKTYH